MTKEQVIALMAASLYGAFCIEVDDYNMQVAVHEAKQLYEKVEAHG